MPQHDKEWFTFKLKAYGCRIMEFFKPLLFFLHESKETGMAFPG